MKKTLSLLATLFLLNGCAETLAFLGPVSTAAVTGGGNIAQTVATSTVSYGIKKKTGKSPTEHALAYVKEHNPEQKKEKCISFIEATKSEVCKAVKKDITETKQKILERSKVENLVTKSATYNKIFKKSKIESLANKSTTYNRRR
tara:strand:+ start:79 stop:513 length:435 start_codon:yes stop_codon:yes gene_type:complete